eukprot:CAMPEP_0118860838 /NCGR_PEP_ID=MMETSP1163-20130328/6557_1 /TAXON_ID=124430 /ORGANISM="Phaeomonas parva, Strain CCMP2877" /LENGTH=72 /DNA_ID=CAMNT_0006794587 /DNA_START=224 /DNA_END=443 /DNA_ORIENTATION=-
MNGHRYRGGYLGSAFTPPGLRRVPKGYYCISHDAVHRSLKIRTVSSARPGPSPRNGGARNSAAAGPASNAGA